MAFVPSNKLLDVRGHLLSTHLKFSETQKLTRTCAIRGLEMFVFRYILPTYLTDDLLGEFYFCDMADTLNQ